LSNFLLSPSDICIDFHSLAPPSARFLHTQWTKKVAVVNLLFFPLDVLFDKMQETSRKLVGFGRAVRSGKAMRGIVLVVVKLFCCA